MFQTFNLALMPGFWMEGKLKEGRFNIIVKYLALCILDRKVLIMMLRSVEFRKLCYLSNLQFH